MGEEKHAGGRPAAYETVEQLDAAIFDYFNPEEEMAVESKEGTEWLKTGRRIKRDKCTSSGLAFHLGFESRQSLYDYRDNKPEFTYSIKRSLLQIEMAYENHLTENNVAGSIFALKNMGWRDKTETELSGGLEVKQITGMVVT